MLSKSFLQRRKLESGNPSCSYLFLKIPVMAELITILLTEQFANDKMMSVMMVAGLRFISNDNMIMFLVSTGCLHAIAVIAPMDGMKGSQALNLHKLGPLKQILTDNI